MKPIPSTLLTSAGGFLLTCMAWAIASFFAGNMTLQGAFLVSPVVGLLFVPMLLVCVVLGVRRGYLAYRGGNRNSGIS